jgi:hypothetical protein
MQLPATNVGALAPQRAAGYSFIRIAVTFTELSE